MSSFVLSKRSKTRNIFFIHQKSLHSVVLLKGLQAKGFSFLGIFVGVFRYISFLDTQTSENQMRTEKNRDYQKIAFKSNTSLRSKVSDFRA